MSNIKLNAFDQNAWDAFAGATGTPFISEQIAISGDRTIVFITDDSGLSAHIFKADGEPEAFWALEVVQAAANVLVAWLDDSHDLEAQLNTLGARWESM